MALASPPGNRALADMQYNSILAAERSTSSDDESPGISKQRDDGAQYAIGPSIGRQQTRLISPTTPAAEKAAVLNQAGGYFDGAIDSSTTPIVESPDEDAPQDELKTSPSQKDFGLPSPWRAGPKLFEKNRSERNRSVLRDGFSFGRRRASSGPESRHKSLFSLPSMPKNFTLGSPFSSSAARDLARTEEREGRKRALSMRPTALPRDSPSSPPKFHNAAASPYIPKDEHPNRSPVEAEEARATVGDLPRNVNLHHVRSRPQALRRSTSDTSLVTQRTMSTVSSLGDDSRFENVSEQVNSRFKAIKDSFQDSKITLPSMPSIASFNVSSFTPDFFNRERSGSASTKQLGHSPRLGSTSGVKQHEKPVDPMTRQPYHSAKAAAADAQAERSAADHPHFNRALEQLEGDIVVLGGYRGSILRSAEPPHRQLWVPIKVGLNIRKVDLEVGLDEDADTRATEKVIPGGMLTHIGPVDIARRLLKRLRNCDNARSGKLRVHEYGYDWRLHPHHLSRQLISFLESLPNNQPGVPQLRKGAMVIAHSLGGLITRHAVNYRPELFSGVVYAGVPNTCVNILGPLRNGDEVLLSSRVLTAQVNFTIRTSFALLPLNGRCFVDKYTKEEYPVDFFDPQTWIDYRLSPCVARPLPPLSPPPKPTGITGYMTSMANALPSLPMPGRKSSKSSVDITKAAGAAAPETLDSGSREGDVALANGNIASNGSSLERDFVTGSDSPSVRTAVTISREAAIAYLTRTLATVKQFKQELSLIPQHSSTNAYPPISVVYGKTTPTVIGAKVDGREGIKHADAYDELAFASGDGVVLARAAMVPEGYQPARGGVVSSERGHVTLLGDLEAIGKCLNAVLRSRRRGTGLGSPPSTA